MHRRLILAVTVGLVVTTGVAPSLAADRTAGCVSLTDARGDAEAPPGALFRPPATPGVDIHGFTLRSDGDRLVGAITVADLAQPPLGLSTRMAFSFVLQRWEFTVFYDVGAVPNSAAEKIYYTQGVSVFDEVVSANVQGSVTGNTLSISVPISELEKIRGKAVRGERLTELSAATGANYGPRNSMLYPHADYDRLTAPRSVTPVLGASCRKA